MYIVKTQYSQLWMVMGVSEVNVWRELLKCASCSAKYFYDLWDDEFSRFNRQVREVEAIDHAIR